MIKDLTELESGDYKPGWAVFNRFRTKRAVAKKELIQARNLIADQLLELRSKEAKAIRLDTEQKAAEYQNQNVVKNLELQEKVMTALQMLEMGAAEANRYLIEIAAEEGMTVESQQQVVVFESFERIRVASQLELEQGKAEIQAVMEAAQSNLRIREEDRAMERRVIEHASISQIDVKRHREMQEIDVETRWKEIVQNLDAADLIELSDVQLINKMTGYLTEMRRDRYQIAQGVDPSEVKDALLARYDKNIANLEARLDARQARLLLSEDGKETLRLTEGNSNSRAVSSEETEATQE